MPQYSTTSLDDLLKPYGQTLDSIGQYPSTFGFGSEYDMYFPKFNVEGLQQGLSAIGREEQQGYGNIETGFKQKMQGLEQGLIQNRVTGNFGGSGAQERLRRFASRQAQQAGQEYGQMRQEGRENVFQASQGKIGQLSSLIGQYMSGIQSQALGIKQSDPTGGAQSADAGTASNPANQPYIDSKANQLSSTDRAIFMNMVKNQQAPTQGEIDNLFNAIQSGNLGRMGNIGAGGGYL